MIPLEDVSSARQPFKLNRFDRVGFAQRIHAGLTPDMTAAAVCEFLYRKIPVGQPELVAKALDGVKEQFFPLWMRDGSPPQTEAERTIYETSCRITSASPKPPRDPREQQLQTIYRKSVRNYAAFTAFSTLKAWIPSAEKFFDHAKNTLADSSERITYKHSS
jgi:hypothetical protein